MAKTSGDSPTSGLFHTAKLIITFMLTIAMFIWLFQIVVEKPSERGIKTCYWPYKLYSFVFISVPEVVLPQDAQLPLRNALRGERYFKLCVVYTSNYLPFYSYPMHLPEFAEAYHEWEKRKKSQ